MVSGIVALAKKRYLQMDPKSDATIVAIGPQKQISMPKCGDDETLRL